MGLFACGNPEEESNERTVAVASAMETIYSAMVSSDGSVRTNYFTLKASGSYLSEEKLYDVNLVGTFDITQSDGSAADNRSQLLLEVKQGSAEILNLYYFEGKLYLNYPPYARRGVISDYRLEDVVRSIVSEKDSGVIKTVADTIPLIASRIFTDCHVFKEDGGDRYVFTLSYQQLFEAFAPIVNSWDAGFSATELLSALHLSEEDRTALAASDKTTKVQFVVKDGAFISAKVTESTSSAETDRISLDTFSLTRGLDEIDVPSSLTSFTEYDFGNFAVAGTMNLRASEKGDRALNYDVTATMNLDADYPFTYDFKSHYVAGSGWEFSLSLTDKNGRASAFDLRGDNLYINLTAYGIAKCKISVDELSSRLGAVGLKDADSYDFRDKLHLLVLLAASRSEEGDTVKYTLGKEVFDLLGEKVGFKGLFGIDGAEISWSTRNERLQDLSLSVDFAGMNASLSAASFTFGTAVELPAVASAQYVDLAEKVTTHLAFSGTIRQTTSFESEGALLTTLLSSLAAKDPSEAAYLKYDFSGAIGYTADLVYGRNGAVKSFFARLFTSRGSEIVDLYYTDATPNELYLISAEQSGSGLRTVQSFTLAENALALFNEAMGTGRGAGKRIHLSARSNVFTVGVQASMLDYIAEKIGRIYPDFSLPYLAELSCRRYDLSFSDGLITAKVVFDDDNEISIQAESFKVTFGDDVAVASVTANAPALVPLLADNDAVTGMPEEATVVFPGGLTYKVSLLTDEGGKIWSYAGIPATMSGKIEEVTATAHLLGKEIKSIVRVDTTAPTAVDIAGSVRYTDRYDPETRTFTMYYYNDKTPKEIFDTFISLIAVVNGVEYPKTISWDLSRVGSAFGANKIDPVVIPRVTTFFGNEITLGTAFNCKLHVDGTIADSTDYTQHFTAYDGKDPLDPAVYSDRLIIKTKDGSTVEVNNVEWDLSNATIESKMRVDPENDKENILYAYTTPEDKPEIVRAIIKDSNGGEKVLQIPITFEARVVDSVSFAGLDGVHYDEGTGDCTFDDLPGVTYNAAKGFTFNVLLVRSLSSTATNGILPQTFIANKDETSEWIVSGIKWEVDPPAESVVNASGKSGTLKLTIGDSISGYQSKTFHYTFTSITVTETSLRDANHDKIDDIDRISMYVYSADHLNAYAFTTPAYVRVGYSAGEESYFEDLPILWDHDENALCNGGEYVLTRSIGSETLTVTLDFDQQRITSYRFGDESAVEALTAAGTLSTHQGKVCLNFSALEALTESGVKFKDVTNYPSALEVAFNGGSAYRSVPVTWDLSAYDAKDEGGKDTIIANGFYGTVIAKAMGQEIAVYVYVEKAFDTIYTNAECTETGLTFRLMQPDGLSLDGKPHKLVVTDPRLAENYPEELYIDVDRKVPVLEWLGLDAVTRLYHDNYETMPPNEIKGEVVVRAKIGDPAVGYKEIAVLVTIEERVLGEISVSGLPLAASSEMTGGTTTYAITPKTVDMTLDGEHCTLSLELNPYYVDPTSSRTYPTYLDFTLDNVPVRAAATWALENVPADAAENNQTRSYLVWAMIDLGPSFKKVKIPVAATVLKREIDIVWVKDPAGKESNERYIDIDGYSYNPFGGDIIGDWVYLDVKVQFKRDANRYPLKLKYNKSEVVLGYDGSNVYPNVSVYVGNESGGYRKITGYTIRILSNVITKVTTENGGTKIFYEANYDSVTGKITYTTPDADSVNIASLPNTITVCFGYSAEGVEVSQYSQDNSGKGVVFKWTRSNDDDNYLGIELMNPSVSAEVGEGMLQYVYNPKQNEFATPTKDLFFDSKFTNSVVYRDKVDAEGEITVRSFLSARDSEILTTKIAAENQIRYITEDRDGAPALEEGDVLSAGSYRLYVAVTGHEQYEGEVYETFTVEKKLLNASFISLYVDGVLHSSDQVDNNGVHFEVYGKTYRLSAGVENYAVNVPLLLGGATYQDVSKVKYTSSWTVDVYTYIVTANEGDPIGKNYTVEPGATISFKLKEAGLPAQSITVEDMAWSPSLRTFTMTVKVLGKKVEVDNDLTNGYKITYYEKVDGVWTSIAEEDLVSNRVYAYKLECKIPNYEKGTILRGDDTIVESR